MTQGLENSHKNTVINMIWRSFMQLFRHKNILINDKIFWSGK